MGGPWWRWLGAVLAIVFGLAFGWVAGIGLVRAADAGAVPAAIRAAPFGGPAGAESYARCAANHAKARFQPSSASALR